MDDLNSDFAQFKIVKKKALSDQRKITELATELCLQQEKLKAERLALNQLKRDLNLAEVLNEGYKALLIEKRNWFEVTPLL